MIYFLTIKFGKISYDGFSAVGFDYNAEKDIFYSAKDAWQKNSGYCHLYDVSAPLFCTIIDTEPIKFYYNNKNWLISFWKGQYGMVTGAEIGIYYTNHMMVDKNTVYMPAKEEDMPKISFTLYRKGSEIAKATARHWWLAIFKLGLFSNPKDLVMDIELTFPSKKMLAAFITAFKKRGYKDKDYKIIADTFYFTYKKPHTRKVWTRNWLTDKFRQKFNKRNVILYNKYLIDLIDDNLIDDAQSKTHNKLLLVNKMIPTLLKNHKKSNDIEVLGNESEDVEII